nr:Hermansky-Pudlak syndrome 4 protein isoform X3 [Misgurnus anguillicaudatus]XP_055024235.1 Hermansky-Pudlak syndrome 4 protein isoform X3 [Misgurnus anguillicaudatus]
MAETNAVNDSRRCLFFFLYDSSKVQEEGDQTKDGIYYFYPEDTPADQQDLLCGQLAGVCRCVSELSTSPVRLLRLRKSKYAVRMKDKFIWALSCVGNIPDVSVCDFLDQLINLFCFYNGPVRQSYQLYSKVELASRWAKYLCHLQGGSTELHNIFSCLKTVDSLNIDPLLLLKAALILQACQRCPLVLAGCILYRGRVVSTQMPPDLTVKVMVYETETYSQDHRVTANGLSSSVATPNSVTVTAHVFLTTTELHMLRCSPVDRACRYIQKKSHCTQPPCQSRKSRLLSRTLSDIRTVDTDSPNLEPTQCPSISDQTTSSSPRSSLSDEMCFSPSPSVLNTPLHSSLMNQSEYFTPESHDPNTSNGTNLSKEQCLIESLNTNDKRDIDENLETGSLHSWTKMKSEVVHLDQDLGENDKALKNGYQLQSNCLENHSDVSYHDNQIDRTEGQRLDTHNHVTNRNDDTDTEKEAREKSEQVEKSKQRHMENESPSHETLADPSLVRTILYQHRVRGLVLALLVEPEFNTDATAREEVYNSSLASLNGLEAHLRNTSPWTPSKPEPYTFAHYDCIQNTLTTNVCGRSDGPQDRAFVRATALLHSHFSESDTLQETIVRSASSAVYGTRSAAQETYFLQQGTPVRNSGSPDAQDSAFSLPKKARQRLLKHGVNLL